MLELADIVLVHGVGPISVGIEAVTKSAFSHVALVADPTTRQLIEAQWGRDVGYQRLDYYAGACLIVRYAGLSDTQRSGIVQYARSKFGDPYDYNAIALELERYVFGRKLTDAERNRFICSTLVGDAYSQGAAIRLSNQPLETPGDIYSCPSLVVVGRA